ncbi:MAG: 50S ribosomal protein L9 [Deltaproteobacteria bacterium]|nr:50S ribosomal protein L9 [Deltaproteobacteria bacterium]
MQLILAEDVPHLGQMGDVVNVRRGYARNYLLPRKLAVAATERNVKEMEHHRRVIDSRRAKILEDARSRAAKLSGTSVTIVRKVAEEEKLYGSVTERDVQTALAAEGFDLEMRQIGLEHHIKNLGVFTVPIHLAHGIDVDVKVWVVAEETEES